ncbi:ECF transporter S component [Thermoanaerobacter sp. RKWS2]|uniref:ECF transporter S component n=1 Tax=Thermoanaerobacter sp. RKWS2 TaxID=2983842 RepID=UPI00224AC143|nr:ECF transporter S component [Thermoanaerobacter sp. RKWS2]UZQ83885.1 ECF transporter S component [Thermoanaerobacter sp. RKWS2]
MEQNNVKKIVYGAFMMALVTIGTMVIQIPTPATKGYINVGDSFIFLSSALFGPAMGFVTGGIGSALADLLSGYAYWSPWTFIIKGIEGLIVGLMYKKYTKEYLKVVSFIIGALWMVLGYYIAGGIMYGFKASLVDVPSNLVQGFASIIIGYILIRLISRLELFNKV